MLKIELLDHREQDKVEIANMKFKQLLDQLEVGPVCSWVPNVGALNLKQTKPVVYVLMI